MGPNRLLEKADLIPAEGAKPGHVFSQAEPRNRARYPITRINHGIHVAKYLCEITEGIETFLASSAMTRQFTTCERSGRGPGQHGTDAGRD